MKFFYIFLSLILGIGSIYILFSSISCIYAIAIDDLWLMGLDSGQENIAILVTLFMFSLFVLLQWLCRLSFRRVVPKKEQKR
jgi:hypothetical protein